MACPQAPRIDDNDDANGGMHVEENRAAGADQRDGARSRCFDFACDSEAPAKHGEGIELSVKTLAKELDVSVDTARRALASCEEAGYLAARANQLKNGGQAENTYVITAMGESVLAAAQDAGVF